MSLNKKYAQLLSVNPLLTKCITAGILASLNEIIASIIAKDFKIISILNKKVKHPFSLKIPLLALFTALIGTPINHFGLKYINLLFKPPFTVKKRISQILTVLLTTSPFINVLFVSFISVLNMKPALKSLSIDEIKRCFSTIKNALRTSLLSVIKSSWMTTPIVLTVCQSYLDPEYWVVFQTFVYFILGTGQNTFLKLKNKKEQELKKRQDELKKDIETNTNEKDSTLIPGSE